MAEGNGVVRADVLFGASATKVQIWNHAIRIIRMQEKMPTLDVKVIDMVKAGAYWIISVEYRIEGPKTRRQLYVSEAILCAS